MGNELCQAQLSDPVFLESSTASSEPHLLSQSDLNDLVRDLDLQYLNLKQNS